MISIGNGTTEQLLKCNHTGAKLAFVVVAMLVAAGKLSAQLEVRRYEAGTTAALEDSERGGPVTITVRAILQDSVPWVEIVAESGTDATLALSLPIGIVRSFLSADPAAFIAKTETVPMDEDRTEVFSPAFTWPWGDYFGLVRKDWWDTSKIAFMFRQGDETTIIAEGSVPEVISIIDLLISAEARIASWNAGG